jgi:hypothetical protein
MFGSCDLPYGFNERFPAPALRGKHLSSFRGQLVKTPAPLPFFFNPTALDPAAFFQAIKQRVQGRHIESKRSLRAQFNQPADVIAVPRLILD